MYLSDALVLLPRDHLSVTGPPAGTVPNYSDPPNNAASCQVVSIFTLALAFVLVVSRVGIKAFIVHRFGWDDYAAILAMLLAAGRVICTALAISPLGFGRHIWDIQPQNIKMMYRLKAIGDTLYPPAMIFSKISILLFYLQIFRVKRWFRYTCWTLMAFDVAYLMSVFFAYLFYCKPEAVTWDYTLKGQCINGWALDMFNGALNIFTDSVILIIPLPMLWQLQLSVRRKIGVSVVFLVGAFTVAASIVREVAVAHIGAQVPYDATWLAVPEVLWLTVEMNVSIISGALLILPSLFPYLAEGALRDRLSGTWFGSGTLKRKWRSTGQLGSSPRPTRRDHFHRQGSEATLELGDILVGRTDTVVEAPRLKAGGDDLERDAIDQGVIQKTRTYSVS